MKQLPCIKKYVPGQSLNTLIIMTNNLTDMLLMTV